jgi:hypothetical protein
MGQSGRQRSGRAKSIVGHRFTAIVLTTGIAGFSTAAMLCRICCFSPQTMLFHEVERDVSAAL